MVRWLITALWITPSSSPCARRTVKELPAVLSPFAPFAFAVAAVVSEELSLAAPFTPIDCAPPSADVSAAAAAAASIVSPTPTKTPVSPVPPSFRSAVELFSAGVSATSIAAAPVEVEVVVVSTVLEWRCGLFLSSKKYFTLTLAACSFESFALV